MTQSNKDKDQSDIDQANNRYTTAKSYWSPFFAKAAEEKVFITGDQWRSDLRTQRESDGRPVVQLPRIQNFIRQLQSSIRQSKPNLIVSANDDATKDMADVVSDLIRTIQAKSNADTAYDAAGESAIATGFGVLRVYTDYPHYTSFDNDVFIESVYDPSTVLFDPASRDHLFEDADYVFLESVFSKDDYARRIGTSTKLSELAKLRGFSKASPMTTDDEHITIVEYYRKVYEKTTIYKYADIVTGETMITDMKIDDGRHVLVNSRTSSTCKILHSLFDGLEFHNTTEIPGQIIPVIPVLGEQTFINRVRQLKGVVRDSMDAQRIINYTASVQLEVTDLAPKVPWLVEESSIDGYENEWRDANSRNYSYLVYKGKNGVAPPQRMPVATDISSIASIKQSAQDDMQNIFGVFNAALGAESNEISGVAIQNRINQSNQSTYVYKDNLYRSIRQVGRVMTQMLPEYYNGRSMNLLSVDGSDKNVTINIDPLAQFEVSIKEGPTNESARQSLNRDLMSLVTAMPSAAPLVADYIIKNSDLPDTDKLVARLQTLLPQEVRAIEAQDVTNMSPQDMQAQMMKTAQEQQQLNAHAQELEMQNQQLQQELDALKADKSFDHQKLMVDSEIKNRQLQLDATKVELEFELQSQALRIQEKKMNLETVTGENLDAVKIPNL